MSILMDDQQLHHIFAEIESGRGRHGSFLTRFAAAFLAADPLNISLLRPAAIAIVGKYNLDRYLDNFDGGEVRTA